MTAELRSAPARDRADNPLALCSDLTETIGKLAVVVYDLSVARMRVFVHISIMFLHPRRPPAPFRLRGGSADRRFCGPRLFLFQPKNRGPQERRSALPCDRRSGDSKYQTRDFRYKGKRVEKQKGAQSAPLGTYCRLSTEDCRLDLIPATTDSPTHFRAQYHGPWRA